MRSKLRPSLTYANVVASLALFLAVTGSAVAAVAITGKNVKDGSLTGKDIQNSSLTQDDIRNGSLVAQDFKAGELPGGGPGAVAGPAGPKGETGAPGAQGPAGPKGENGLRGEIGAKGEQGVKGDTGEKGESGTKGDAGTAGAAGATGTTGPKGTTGMAGPPGGQGPGGPTGPTGTSPVVKSGFTSQFAAALPATGFEVYRPVTTAFTAAVALSCTVTTAIQTQPLAGAASDAVFFRNGVSLNGVNSNDNQFGQYLENDKTERGQPSVSRTSVIAVPAGQTASFGFYLGGLSGANWYGTNVATATSYFCTSG